MIEDQNFEMPTSAKTDLHFHWTYSIVSKLLYFNYSTTHFSGTSHALSLISHLSQQNVSAVFNTAFRAQIQFAWCGTRPTTYWQEKRQCCESLGWNTVVLTCVFFK
jgi:hypothetical protein